MIISDVNTAGASGQVFRLDRDALYVHISGPFDTASVQLQQQLEDESWADIVGAVYTAPANEVIELGARRNDGKPTAIRSVTSGVGVSTAMILQLK